VFVPLSELDRHAVERTGAIALATPGQEWSFGELKAAVDAVAIRLRVEGIRPRQIVGVDLPSALEWIVDLALLRLAARSVSLRGVPPFGGLELDALVASPGGRTDLGPLRLQVDELWMASAVNQAAGAVPAVEYPRSDSIFRLMLTSGTTGMPRAAAYSVGALERRRESLPGYWSDGRAELNFMPLSTTGGLHTAIANLLHGQTHLAVDFINETTLRFAAARGVRVLCGSPAQIASALDVLAKAQLELGELEEVRMAGATPSARLLQLISERLGVPVRGVYGSTEAGGVTSRMLAPGDNLADVGPVLPGLELQIVNDNGEPMPCGTEGNVRYRGPAMTSGYFEQGKISEFGRGWFEPGDVGMLSPEGSLVLAGRTAEIINVAGRKVNPSIVDEIALDFAGVDDAAAFGLERENGIAELGLAVVATHDCDLHALDRLMRARLATGHPTTFWRVAEIPRNRMGKAERSALGHAFARTLATD
jgi:long-chain acyl-CoA synthetase